jgi:NADPH:quinone reductase-like Zn-dependent oxidoreductase
MVLERVGSPLVMREIAKPEPAIGEIQIDVETCGVCRTDLHIFDGELAAPKLPLVLGHQVVGTVSALRFASETASGCLGWAGPGPALVSVLLGLLLLRTGAFSELRIGLAFLCFAALDLDPAPARLGSRDGNRDL